MLKEFLCDVDNFVSKIPEVSIIPMFNNNGNAVISGKSNDNQVFFSIRSKENYDKEEFAFRDWLVISSALSSFSKEENFDVKLETTKDKESGKDFPSRIIFKTKSLSINHFLQKYPAIQKSEQVLKQYKERRFIIPEAKNGLELPNIEANNINELLKVSGILGKKDFSLDLDGKKLFYCLGDTNSKSSDNAKILISDTVLSLPTDKLYFSIQAFIALIKAFNYNCKIYLTKTRIYIFGETDINECTFVINGKANES